MRTSANPHAGSANSDPRSTHCSSNQTAGTDQAPSGYCYNGADGCAGNAYDCSNRTDSYPNRYRHPTTAGLCQVTQYANGQSR